MNGIEYEMYQYTKDDFNRLFGLEISRGVFLLFNADILSAVYYRFEGDKFDYLLETVNRFLPKKQHFIIDPFVSYKRATLDLGNNVLIDLKVNENGDTGLSMRNENFYSNKNDILVEI